MSLSEPTTFTKTEVFSWTDTAALPLLPNEKSLSVFSQLRKSPRLDRNSENNWRARPTAELHATNDKFIEIDGKEMELMVFSEKKPAGYWPIFKGESFDIWNSDTGVYYAWADPDIARTRIQSKRKRGQRNKRSVYAEFKKEYIEDQSTLECNRPRIAFRNVTNRTNRRTIIAALIPPQVFISHAAPFILWPRGDKKDEAYLLGVLSSIPLDWYARRFVEINVTFHHFNPFPVPRPTQDNPFWHRVVQIAGRLGAPDDRFAEWAEAVGVKHGEIEPELKQDMIHELDAVVAHLYGLSKEQLSHIFETFHEGWDYTSRLEATLVHYDLWSNKI